VPVIAKMDELLRDEGDDPLALPKAMSRALAATSRLGFCLTLLEAAEQHALDPRAPIPTGLRARREACGLADAALDDLVVASTLADGSLLIPNAALLHRVVTDAIEELIAFLARSPGTSASAAGLHERAQALLARLPRIEGDRVPTDYVSELSRPREGQDSLHALVTELHHAVDTLNATLARESVDGASAYAIRGEDHPTLRAFMRGVARTRHLALGAAALATVATRGRAALIIRTDVGPGDAHLLEVRVAGLECEVTYANPHLRTMRFFQDLLAAFEVAWNGARPRPPDGVVHHRCVGRFAAKDAPELERFLERLGSRVVFLLDWNRARKRLRHFVDGPGSVEVLRWAADNDVGHRAFLQLGGERLVYDAIESAATAPLRYGQRLDEMLGRGATIEFLEFMLRVTSAGVEQHRSLRFIQD
jgi:hypothetical protein